MKLTLLIFISIIFIIGVIAVKDMVILYQEHDYTRRMISSNNAIASAMAEQTKLEKLRYGIREN